MSLSLTAKKGTKETLGAALHSLNNSTVQPNRVNSELSGVNVLSGVVTRSFFQADIYQPACPSNSTLFVIASPRLFAHSVMPQTPLCFSL